MSDFAPGPPATTKGAPIAPSTHGNNASKAHVDQAATARKIHSGMGLADSQRHKPRAASAIVRSLARAVNAKKHTTLALTRLALATVAAVAINAAPLSANTITVFDVEGTVTDVSRDYGLYGINNFSETLTVDASTGLPLAVHVTFPGLDPFDYIWSTGVQVSIPDNAWEVVATDEPYPPGPTKYRGGGSSANWISCISTFSPNRIRFAGWHDFWNSRS
jgi:hypothetical protein